MSDHKSPVLVVGGGMAGLTVAYYLHKKGIEFILAEAGDHIGGRVKTDDYQGFKLDHGFQVFLPAYPEAKAVLDYDRLDLQYFLSGAHISNEDGKYNITEPNADLITTLSSMLSPVATTSDKLRVLELKYGLKKTSIDEIFARREQTTIQYLQDKGFSDKVVKNFFRPFMSGIFLEPDLKTSSRMFEFVFKMFSEGRAAVPRKGIGEIPKQIAAGLPADSIKTGTTIYKTEGHEWKAQNGETFTPSKVIWTAPDLWQGGDKEGFISNDSVPVTCFYFEGKRGLMPAKTLGLNGKDNKWINNFCEISNVSSDYAPSDKGLYSASVLEYDADPSEEKITKIKDELARLIDADDLHFVTVYPIKKALPGQEHVQNHDDGKLLQVNNDVITAGDGLFYGSLNAAMKSGRLAAEKVIEQLKVV